MKIEVVESKENEMVFDITGVEPQVVNALRRTILGEVPVMAISEVTFYENDSVMPDEYVAHRLGMVPLTTDLKAYKPEDGNSVDFNLDEQGPKMVYSSDLKTGDPKVKPVSGKVPIAELLAGQRLRLEAKAVLGKGEDHARWQAGNAFYRNLAVEKKAAKPTMRVLAEGQAEEKEEYDPTGFRFTVETNGQMTPAETLEVAIDILKAKAEEMRELVKQ
jgi:DNA-directed RNA polymerase subunit D